MPIARGLSILRLIALVSALAATGLAAAPLGGPGGFEPGAAQIVILGEVHDNPHHHANQAAILARLSPAALVFEMLSPEQAAAADGVDRADPEALAAALAWAESGWPDFSLYAPVFAAAPEGALYGAAVPRSALMAAIREGAAAVFEEPAALPPLAEEDQALLEAELLAAHCDALPPEMLPGMVEAQRLRDAAFAATALEALAETGGPVAVVTGIGHARTDRGIPVYLARLAPEARVVSLGQFEAEPEPPVPFDAWLVTPPAEREDPCAAFD